MDNEFLLYELDLEYDDELLEMFYPLFNQEVRAGEMTLYRMIDDAVEISVSEMGSASFRGSRHDTIKLLERDGYNGKIVSKYIEEYERKTLEEFYRSRKKDS